MEKVTFITYLGWVVWIGFIITGDAFISTLGQFHNEKLRYWNWAGFLALTHSFFPAVSFIVFAAVASVSESFGTSVSLVGALFILLVVHEMLCDAFGTDPIFSLSESIEKWTKLHKHKAKHFVKVLAVSWDALSLGPILLLHSEQQQWNEFMIIGMFIIFAVVVGLSLVITLKLTTHLREKHFTDAGKLAKLNFYGSFFEISVISSFAITLLLEIFSVQGSMFLSLVVSTSIFSVVFASNKSILWTNAQAEAAEAVAE